MHPDRRRAEAHSRLPFSEGPPQAAHLNMRRLSEGLIIACLAGFVSAVGTTWATSQVLTVKIEQHQQDIRGLQQDIRQLRRDLYRPLLEPSTMLLSELIEDLRASLHDAADVFDTSDLSRHIRIALNAVALHKRARQRSAEISLVAGQTRYAAPDDLVSVDRLVWQNGNSRSPWSGLYPGPAPLAALVETAGDREIALHPPPTAQQVQALAGKCTLLYRARHELELIPGEPSSGPEDPGTADDYTITTLSAADRDLVLLRAQAEACRELAIRGSTKPVNLRAGGLGQPSNATPGALWQALMKEWMEAP